MQSCVRVCNWPTRTVGFTALNRFSKYAIASPIQETPPKTHESAENVTVAPPVDWESTEANDAMHKYRLCDVLEIRRPHYYGQFACRVDSTDRNCNDNQMTKRTETKVDAIKQR